MSDDNLLHLITSYGTRKSCPMEQIAAQYGAHHRGEMMEDLDRLIKKGKIEIRGAEVWLMMPQPG